MTLFTFLACTYNLSGTTRWEERRRSLERFLEVNRPDVLCVQELRPESCDLISDTLPWMRRVGDPFPGWTEEGNIFWNSDLFDLVDYGAEDIGIVEKSRRLFWVRLVNESGDTVVVATAHLSWLEEAGERGEWVTVRVAQAEAAVASLGELVRPDEPVLLMGDFNDYLYPIDVLSDAGFEDSFRALGRVPVITHPARLTSEDSPTLLDWMMHSGPGRPTLTSVVDFFVDEIPPSDHKPILTTYTVL
jgi:endonuclease/exonuclease/phosphatase family metal-dependent hydrolase